MKTMVKWMKEKINKYWEDRFTILTDSLLNLGEKEVSRLEEEYEKGLLRLQREMEPWYGKLARNNNISMAEAVKLLKADELKEFKWTLEEYVKYGRENSLNQKWVKELQNASAKVHITRLEEMQIGLRQQVESLYAARTSGIDDVLGNIYRDGYYGSIYELQKQAPFRQFEKLDHKNIMEVLSQPWNDGKTFSEKIWEDREKLANRLETGLSQAIIRGDSLDQLIKLISKEFNANKYAASRLVMTESAYFASLSQLHGFKEMGVKKYKIVATLDKKTSDICRHMDNMVMDIKYFRPGVSAPPFHCFCRSCVAPYFEHDTGTRIARNEDGENYYIPANMTYKEWEEKYVHNGKNPSEKGNKEEATDYLVRSHTPGENTTKLRILANDVIAGMPDNVQNAIHMGTIIDLGKNGASQYDYSRDILYVSKNSSKGEIIHEIGHIVDSKILNSDIVSAIRRDTIGDVGICDIKATTYYDSDGNPKDIFCIENEKLISEYQGRIYVDNIFDAFDGDGKFRDDLLWEFISEAFREYIENPVNLSTHSQKIFDLIKEGVE